jgi:hypothetical protein
MSAMTDPMEISGIVRNACIQAALEGYEQAQIAGLCQEGAWECAVDAMRMVDLPEPFILVVVGEDEAAVQHATLHAGIAGQLVDLAAAVVGFVRATP